MNILVTGANGQLGSEIKVLSKNYSYNFFFTNKKKLDIRDKEKIKIFTDKNKIDLIINCAAYTAVDRAESEKKLADLINHKAVQNLAEVSKQKNITLIHISTDYVFDGKNYKPYTEEDKTNPQGIYGLTKLKGEESFRNSEAKGIIIRTSWVYSSFGHNFVKTMLRLKDRGELGVVFDQVGTPTYARDLAKTILEIIDKSFEKLNSFKAEIFHFSNEGVCSWYDFAKAIFEIKDIDIKIDPIETKDYPTPAKRPHYSVLNKNKIKKEFNIKIPYWRDSLKNCLKEIDE